MQGSKTGTVLRGLLTIVFLMGMALFGAVPAGATHDCADTATADSGEGTMHTDTQFACPESAGGGAGGGGLPTGTAGSGGSTGAVPTRIDAGAGGAAAAGTPMALGAVLTGAAVAGAGALAAWRRRR